MTDEPAHDFVAAVMRDVEQTPQRGRSWRGWPLAAGVAMAAVVVAVLVVLSVTRTDIGVASPTPSPSSTPTPSASASAPPPSPTLSPTPTASPTPLPTIAPRTGWTTHQVVDVTGSDYARVIAVEEARGVLYAMGAAGRSQPGIWYSADGVNWTAAEVPALPDRLGGYVRALVDTGDRFIAIAGLGYAEGSGLFGTMIYASDDGRTWSEVTATPGVTDAGTMFDVARVDDRLVAVGSGVWISDDAGLSWTEAPGGASIEGQMTAVDERDGLLVAAGTAGGGDIANGPAVVSVSTDRGDHWVSAVVGDQTSMATSVAIGDTGTVIVAGHGHNQITVWKSDDRGSTWTERLAGIHCCANDIVATPTGWVIVGGHPDFPGGALLSVDGVTWVDEPLDVDAQDATWGPTFGLAAAGDPGSVALGPVPAP